MALSDNEIIKALEDWLNEICKSHQTSIDLGYESIAIDTEKYMSLLRGTIDLINRQKAEIESIKTIHKSYVNACRNIKAKAIKEFAERLKEKLIDPVETWLTSDVVREEDIDNLVKEMVGDNDESTKNS